MKKKRQKETQREILTQDKLISLIRNLPPSTSVVSDRDLTPAKASVVTIDGTTKILIN